jgi:DNA-binding CsgD family transcriptional regulator
VHPVHVSNLHPGFSAREAGLRLRAGILPAAGARLGMKFAINGMEMGPNGDLTHAGGAPMTMQIARKVMDHFRKIQQPAADMEKLTPREQEVLALPAKGYLYKQIGDELNISINTLRNRLRAIYEKLHVHSRTEATVKFFGRD